MTTAAAAPTSGPASPSYTAAGTFLEHLVRRDFDGLGETVAEAAYFQALVPRGLREWTGPDGVREAFTGWFGDLDDFDVVEAVVGGVGDRLHLRWRARARGEKLDGAWCLVEQEMYADTDDSGRLTRLRLLCSGFCPEQARSGA